MNDAPDERPWYRRPRFIIAEIIVIIAAVIGAVIPIICAPPPLTSPVLKEIGGEIDDDGEFQLSWNKVEAASNYIVEESSDPSFLISKVIYEGDQTFCNIYGKKEGIYYYRCRARHKDGESAWSSTKRITVEYRVTAPPPDFEIAIKPERGQVDIGGTIQSDLNIRALHGYDYPIDLTVDNLPPCVHVSFNPSFVEPGISDTSAMLIKVSSDASTGSCNIIVVASGTDGRQHTCRYDLTITEPPDFKISVMPPDGRIEKGSTVQSVINVIGLYGYEQAIRLSAINQPDGVNITFTPSVDTPDPTCVSDMLIDVDKDVPAGEYAIIIRATGLDGLEHTCEYNLVVVTPPPYASFTALAAGDKVDSPITLEGTSGNIPENHVLWIVIYLEELDRYYPQEFPVVMDETGTWSSFTYIGNESDTGKLFDIIIVLADESVQEVFQSYLDECEITGSWPGISGLPANSVELATVVVVRK